MNCCGREGTNIFFIILILFILLALLFGTCQGW